MATALASAAPVRSMERATSGWADTRAWEPSSRGRGGRTAVIVTGDGPLRHACASELRGLRWAVREAGGAAEMFRLLEEEPAEAVLVDSWLPDLEVRECVGELGRLYPELDVLSLDGTDLGALAARGTHRSEALHALRQAQERMDAPAWKNGLPAGEILKRHDQAASAENRGALERRPAGGPPEKPLRTTEAGASGAGGLPEFVGTDPRLQEVSRRIRLVAHRKTPVLVHGATGTGKELVARALHRLSGRPAERFVAINCAAIPEALVEAELFGYARGAFTGAQQSRVGRIEAAAGGTLFLDEIGELPLAVQSKLLRFLESGEIQRVGENEVVHVDARVVAATHRKLGAMAAEGTFRLDLLHRLSVFLIQTPSLDGRHEDIDALISHKLRELGTEEPPKQICAEARVKLHAHSWPGNVRELVHTVERAWILAGESSVIGADCVDFGEALL